MSVIDMIPWKTLERWRATMFLVGAVILVGAAVVALYDVIYGTEVRLPLGQVFVGSGWTAVVIGMLGLYPRLADQRPWLARACAFLAGIGVMGYSVMTVVYVAAVAGLPESTLESLTPVFLPAVLVGSLLAFPLFAVTSLLTGAYSRAVGILLVAPPVIFVVNVLTGPTADSIFGVLVALILVYGTIGSLLRTETVPSHRAEQRPEPATR